MTRRRIIAGVILLAAVVVAVPFVPGVWERMAYREDVYETKKDGLTFRFVILIQRWSWLPGDDAIFPEQLCSYCKLNEHRWCCAVQRSFLLLIMKDAYGLDLPDSTNDFPCTCTDPSHDGD